MAGRFVRSLRSFRRRRIDIPVGADALVLDVGSGDKPHWRADVLVDRYAGPEHGGQRSGRAAARVSRPLFDADAAALPFADDAFDYVVCSHVLEHVPDPAAVVAEITRVGRAGYIELPEAASAKILDFPSHLWWCRRDGDTIVLTAKSARDHDPEVGRYIADSGLERRLARLLDSEFDHRILTLRWTGAVDLRVEGTPDPDLVAAALTAAGPHQRGQTMMTRVVTVVLTLPLRHGPRRIARSAPIRYDDIIAPERRRGTGEVLTRQVYRV